MEGNIRKKTESIFRPNPRKQESFMQEILNTFLQYLCHSESFVPDTDLSKYRISSIKFEPDWNEVSLVGLRIYGKIVYTDNDKETELNAEVNSEDTNLILEGLSKVYPDQIKMLIGQGLQEEIENLQNEIVDIESNNITIKGSREFEQTFNTDDRSRDRFGRREQQSAIQEVISNVKKIKNLKRKINILQQDTPFLYEN